MLLHAELDATWEFDVMISHAGEQRKFARDLVEDLESLGIKAYLANSALKGGDNARASMQSAASTAPVGVAYLSSEFFKKVCLRLPTCMT
jgi:hypothetical protein